MSDEDTGINVDAAVDAIGAGLGLGISNDETAETETTETAATETTTAASAVVEEEIPVPKSWAKEAHELWSTTPAPVRKQIALREKQILDGLDAYKNDATYGRSLRDAIKPFTDMLKAQGVDEVKAISYLLSGHQNLSHQDAAKRLEHLKALAGHYKIDLAALTGSPAAKEDPALTAVKNELNEIKSSLTAREQASLNEARERVAKDVDAFFADTKAHPYVEEVADDMMPFLRSGMSLQDAYEKAVWANPISRAKEQGKAQTELESKLKENARLDALKARKASGVNVRSRDTNRTPTEPLGTMDDTLRGTLKEIKERVH